VPETTICWLLHPVAFIGKIDEFTLDTLPLEYRE
jgi:hypothetical protein